MVTGQTQPIAFLFQLMLGEATTTQTNDVTVAAAELLIGQIKATTFAEF